MVVAHYNSIQPHQNKYLLNLKMKFLTITALITAATAAPTTLTPRADSCGPYGDIISTATEFSPLIADCQALSASNLPEPWIPSEANLAFDFKHGTCGFKARFDPDAGSLPMSEMVVDPLDVSLVIDHLIENYAVDGKISAKGNFMCLKAGWKSQTGWTRWEVYKVE
ncbi:hypothetical protein B0T14DRAFT_518201 [Immersiella caudata]|uniref:Ecp2 effector protein-like domain-containing protein n=1 Tax=Immersiella caudata TaxID=314043 RepID=A0AA40BZ76_9PEZI|nr:hypothetical protein B0T14DRAFT_518201 [Immersiella caudata]